MKGDSFVVYYGGLMVNVAAVELSFNRCSHDCQYCFAILNKPDRKADIQATMNRLSKLHKSNALESVLMREKYPVLVSNRVDPFAVSNYRQALPVIELMAEMEIPMTFQTKGGRGIDEVLEFLPPSCWYISIATIDDDIRQRVEPGAPSIPERLALIEKLIDAGHYVNVGINPAVPEWIPDPDALAQAIAERGTHGVWVAIMHLNSNQTRVMTDKGKAALGEAVITRALRRSASEEYCSFLDSVEYAAQSAGLEVFSGDHPGYSQYWKYHKEIYPKRMPLIQDFINHLVDSGVPENSLITVDQYVDFMEPFFPEGVFRAGEYIGAMSPQVKGEGWTDHMTYRRLLEIIWLEGKVKMSPTRNRAFSYACDRGDDGELRFIVDEDGFPILTWSTKGFKHTQIEV